MCEDERRLLLNEAEIDTVYAVPRNELNIVSWDSSEDPANPRNWSTNRKSSIVTVSTAIAIISSVPIIKEI